MTHEYKDALTQLVENILATNQTLKYLRFTDFSQNTPRTIKAFGHA